MTTGRTEWWDCPGCGKNERQVGDLTSVHDWPSMCNACNETNRDIAMKALTEAAKTGVGSPRQLIGLADEMIRFGMKAEARVVLERVLERLA